MAYLGTAPPSASNMMFIFVDRDDDEIGGLCQNGSVTSAEISGWMQIVYTLLFDQFATFPCAWKSTPMILQANTGRQSICKQIQTVLNLATTYFQAPGVNIFF